MSVILTSDQVLAKLQAAPRPWTEQYLAMYSSVWQGIITEPWLMMAPIDDHLVHRGDGVFEAIKCVDGGMYELDRHLARLAWGAGLIHIAMPLSLDELKQLSLEVVKAANMADCLLRIIISRGPGSMNANPAESVGAQVYIVACSPHTPAPEKYEQGVKLGLVEMPFKPGFYANVKSCSYLLNVMVKHQANLHGWDYPLWCSPEGLVSEGATENFALLDKDNSLVFPEASLMLEGITLQRAMELAEVLPARGLVEDIQRRVVRREDVLQARELMIISTSLDVLPATSLNDQPVADGKPGPVALALLELMRADIKSGLRSTMVRP